MTLQAVVPCGGGLLDYTYRGLGRRHPQGLVETEECLARRVGAARTLKAAAEPCRTVETWVWPLAWSGRMGRPQSQDFRVLACCR